MKYLKKNSASKIIKEGWVYKKGNKTNNDLIRDELVREQYGYCAYTEQFLTPISAIDIEHFDDRLKNTDRDSYWNWYAVGHWVNQRKRRIENFLPILEPYDLSLQNRIVYENNGFHPVDPNDVEAKNLIKFLKWNDPGVAEARSNHLSLVKKLQKASRNEEEFRAMLGSSPALLSFRSMLEVELELDLSE